MNTTVRSTPRHRALALLLTVAFALAVGACTAPAGGGAAPSAAAPSVGAPAPTVAAPVSAAPTKAGY